MSDCLMIEPWVIASDAETLTLREEATGRGFVLIGGVTLGLSLIGVALDVWLWTRGTIEGGLAAWLGFASAMVAAKGIEQFFQAWRVLSRGPRCLTFRRDDVTVDLDGFRGLAGGRVERIVISVQVWQHPDYPHERPRQYSVQLFVEGQCLELGTFAAEALADRLADLIAECVGIGTSRIQQA